MVERFGNMLAELRAFGEGLGVVDQIPTKIIPDAIKNTATKVVHRVPAEDDRVVMAGTMNASEEQSAVLTALKPGEAVLGIEGHPVPVRVEVEDVVAKLGVPLDEVTDADVRKRMAGFHLRNSLPREAPRPVEERVRELVDSVEFREGFVGAYRAWLKTGDAAPLRGVLERAADGLGRRTIERSENMKRILKLATAYYLPFDAEDRARFPALFMKTARSIEER